MTELDTNSIRKEFPILNQTIRGKRLCYLDNAATTQKPQFVIQKISDCLTNEYAAVSRGVHYLSQNISAKYEAVREQVAKFINAKNPREIIFTSGTTAGLNLLAYSLSELLLKNDGAILITAMEHHANLIPWQMAAKRYGRQLRVLPITANGELDLTNFEKLLDGVKIFACTHSSNLLGTINDIKELNRIAKSYGAITVFDGAQAIAHNRVDVQEINCDFYVFSGHKIYAPTGVGVLYGLGELLEQMPPFLTGGAMISTVSFENTEFAQYPQKFEAGTPPVIEVIGLGAALEWIEKHGGVEKFAAYKNALRAEFEAELNKLDGITIHGKSQNKTALTSWTMNGIHPHDVGTILDDCGIAVRVGHHCAEPLTKLLQVPATIRASFAIYNNSEDIKQLIEGIKTVQRFFNC